jgi:hypothetical protein
MSAVYKPKLFVGSSSEGKDVAHAVRQSLRDVAEIQSGPRASSDLVAALSIAW